MSDTHPSNRELAEAFDKHAKEDKSFQDESRRVNVEMGTFKTQTEDSLAAIHKRLGEIPDSQQTATIVEDVMGNLIKSKGKTAYTGLLIVAGIVGALVVIGGGAKALLGWIGFSYIGK